MDELKELLVYFVYGIGGAIFKFIHERDLLAARKERLRQMLDGSLKWRSVSALSANIAADRQLTKTLLVQIGARQMKDKPYHWGLISRVGQP